MNTGELCRPWEKCEMCDFLLVNGDNWGGMKWYENGKMCEVRGKVG